MHNNTEHHPLVYLASRSPRRVELLKQIGIASIIHPADIDEAQLSEESAQQYVIRLAREKAHTCLLGLSAEQRIRPIIAADTTVALEDKVLGKPDNDNHARQMLSELSGSRHLVHTAVALAFKNNIEVILSTTAVEMIRFSAQQIECYIASGEHRDKAGSYGIQGLAGAWIRKIEGSYTGVMGLPVCETAELLRKHAIIHI